MIGPSGSVSPDPAEPEVAQLASPQPLNDPQSGRPRDLYAESELVLRHERTERMIKRAQEQA